MGFNKDISTHVPMNETRRNLFIRYSTLSEIEIKISKICKQSLELGVSALLNSIYLFS
jgi:hypothetical protein